MKSKFHLVCFFALSIFLKRRPTQVFVKWNLHLSRYVHEMVYNWPKSLPVIACTIRFYYTMIETEIMVAQMSCKVFIFAQCKNNISSSEDSGYTYDQRAPLETHLITKTPKGPSNWRSLHCLKMLQTGACV